MTAPRAIWFWVCKRIHRYPSGHGAKALGDLADLERFRCSSCIGPVRYVLPSQHSKRYQADHKARGLCICCKRKATRGLRCTRHANEHRDRERVRRRVG